MLPEILLRLVEKRLMDVYLNKWEKITFWYLIQMSKNLCQKIVFFWQWKSAVRLNEIGSNGTFDDGFPRRGFDRAGWRFDRFFLKYF